MYIFLLSLIIGHLKKLILSPSPCSHGQQGSIGEKVHMYAVHAGVQPCYVGDEASHWACHCQLSTSLMI